LNFQTIKNLKEKPEISNLHLTSSWLKCAVERSFYFFVFGSPTFAKISCAIFSNAKKTLLFD